MRELTERSPLKGLARPGLRGLAYIGIPHREDLQKHHSSNTTRYRTGTLGYAEQHIQNYALYTT